MFNKKHGIEVVIKLYLSNRLSFYSHRTFTFSKLMGRGWQMIQSTTSQCSTELITAISIDQ